MDEQILKIIYQGSYNSRKRMWDVVSGASMAKWTDLSKKSDISTYLTNNVTLFGMDSDEGHKDYDRKFSKQEGDLVSYNLINNPALLVDLEVFNNLGELENPNARNRSADRMAKDNRISVLAYEGDGLITVDYHKVLDDFKVIFKADPAKIIEIYSRMPGYSSIIPHDFYVLRGNRI